MLRITIEKENNPISIKLEGRIIQPWAEELSVAWTDLAASLQGRKVVVDLREVIFVAEEGMEILQRIYRESGAELLTGSPLTQYFAEVIRRSGRPRVQEVN